MTTTLSKFVRRTSASTHFPDHTVEDDLEVFVVESPWCHASILAQGAQVLEFRDQKQVPLLWLSPAARFQQGKSPRGGVPICLPWFGPWKGPETRPQHGFVRNRDWTLSGCATEEDGAVNLLWQYHHEGQQTPGLFPWSFRADVNMVLSDHLEISLKLINLSDTIMPVSWALHSYHPVSDLEQTRISGLETSDYLDNTDNLVRRPASADLHFGEEFDRIYLDVPATQRLHNRAEGSLLIRGESCPSAIVWNPGEEKAAVMTDLTAEHYRKFVCLERGMAADNAISLVPGEVISASVSISGN